MAPLHVKWGDGCWRVFKNTSFKATPTLFKCNRGGKRNKWNASACIWNKSLKWHLTSKCERSRICECNPSFKCHTYISLVSFDHLTGLMWTNFIYWVSITYQNYPLTHGIALLIIFFIKEVHCFMMTLQEETGIFCTWQLAVHLLSLIYILCFALTFQVCGAGAVIAGNVLP